MKTITKKMIPKNKRKTWMVRVKKPRALVKLVKKELMVLEATMKKNMAVKKMPSKKAPKLRDNDLK